MANFDVFNGDADGIISLVQLRRAELAKVDAKAGDNLTVLDISMRSNSDDLQRILKAGANVFYVDHHKAIIDTSPEMCTAILVDAALDGAYRAWAVCAAFGDNFPKLAQQKAKGYDLPLDKLQRLGILVNYNGYGADVSDLIYHPKDLYSELADFDTPMAFLQENNVVFQNLEAAYEGDLSAAKAAKSIDGGFLVSIRAPLSNRSGADKLAMEFETGGGRSAAAGINHLPDTDLERFITAFRAAF